MLGDGKFLEAVLEHQKEKFERCYRLQANAMILRKSLIRLESSLALEGGDLWSKQKAGAGTGKDSRLLLRDRNDRDRRCGTAGADAVCCEQSSCAWRKGGIGWKIELR
jgi:hypothetical protein